MITAKIGTFARSGFLTETWCFYTARLRKGGGFTVCVFDRGGAFDGGVVVLQYEFSIEEVLLTEGWWFYSTCFR